MARALLRRLDRARIAAELRRSSQAFAAAFGRPPDFVDGHQHVHSLPQVRDALLAVTKEMAPHAWVRQCGGVSAGRCPTPKACCSTGSAAVSARRAEALGIRTNPAFAGTYTFTATVRISALFPRFLEACRTAAW